MKKMVENALPEQVKQINRILKEERDNYTVADVFNILPCKIMYQEKTGYIKISKFDIVYSSLETERENKVVIMWSFMLNNQNIFDAFIQALEWFEKHNLDIEILED